MDSAAGEGRQGSEEGSEEASVRAFPPSTQAWIHQAPAFTAEINVAFPLRNDGTEFGGSIYQKVNEQLETAVNLAWTAGNSNTRFGIAAKYQIDPDASFSVSFNISSTR